MHNRNDEGYKTDITLKQMYVLCSAFIDGDTIIPVKLGIKEFFDKPNRLYVAVALEGIKKDRVVSMGVPNNRSHVRTSPVTISISEIFKNVNIKDKDFIKYIPKQFFENSDNDVDKNPDSGAEERPAFTETSSREHYREPTLEQRMDMLNGRNRNAAQRQLEAVAGKFGLKIRWNPKYSKGAYDPETKTIILNPALSLTDAYIEVFKHEFVHFLEGFKGYDSFKRFLMKHSKNFEEYVRGALEKENGTPFEGSREEAIKAYTDIVMQKRLNSEEIPLPIKKAYNTEKIEREIVADFVGEVMLFGKNVQKCEKALLEIAETDRNLFQKIRDWLKDVISILKGEPQNRTLAEDIEYLDNRLARVFDSAQKRNANKGEVKYSNNGKSYVQASRKVIHGESVAEWRKQISNFFNTSLKNGPIEINTVEGDTLTITKETAEKARDRNITENGVTRKLTDEEFLVKLHAESHIDELAEISVAQKSNKGNKNLVVDTKNHNFAKDGFTYRTVYFQDFDGGYYRISLSIGENNGISTIYNVGKIKADNIPNGNIVSAIGSKADMLSADNRVTQNPFTVKNNSMQESENNSLDESFSVGSPMQQARENLAKYENGEMSQEEYLEENDRLWGEANEKYGTIEQGENAESV